LCVAYQEELKERLLRGVKKSPVELVHERLERVGRDGLGQLARGHRGVVLDVLEEFDCDVGGNVREHMLLAVWVCGKNELRRQEKRVRLGE